MSFSRPLFNSTNQLRRNIAAAIGAVLLATMASAQAQTYVWADNAQGQIYEVCGTTTNYWPSNNIWSQSYYTNGNCNSSGSIVSQPSNWSPTPPYGLFPGGSGMVGADVILGPPANTLANSTATLNSITIQSNGSLTVGSINLSSYYFDFQGDGVMGQAGNDVVTLLPGGMIQKSGGTNSYVLGPPLEMTDGTVEVDSGTLVLNASLNYTSTGGTFNASNNSTLNLTGGGSAYWVGAMNGAGAGHVLLSSGEIVSSGLSFNFPSNYFWWTGGSLGQEGQGNSYFTNLGVMTAFTASGPIFSAAYFFNEGLFVETNAGSINGAIFENEALGTYEFAGDGSLASGLQFINSGLLRKSSGTGGSVVSNFANLGGTVEADSGTLTLAGGGSSSNGLFVATANAEVDLTGGSETTWAGTMTGSGAGQVLLQSGEIEVAPTGLVLNFPAGLFTWTGGGFYNNQATNLSAITIAANNSPALDYCTFYNQGQMLQTNAGNFSVGAFALINEPSGIYEFDGDGGSTSGNIFVNQGLLRKRYGTGTSVMGCVLEDSGGTIEADSGVLVLANGASVSSNGVFVVGTNAVVDLTGGVNGSTWAGTMTGSGPGQVLLDSGDLVISSNGLNLNFPLGMFWWTGGNFYGATGQYFTNSNSITIYATNSPSLSYEYLWNAGVMKQTNGGTFSLGAFGMVNLTSGIFEFDGDGGTMSGGTFNNYGLLRKHHGPGVSTLTSTLTNIGGSIEVDSGTLSVPGPFSTGGGALTIGLAGSGAGQCGQLLVNGSAALGGPLTVNLLTNFTAVPGSLFQILACSGLSGGFTSINIPFGFSLTNNNTGVYLVALPPPVAIQPPQLSNHNLTFAFSTLTNQSYTIQQNTNLATSNWIFYSNFIGTGSLMQVIAPETNIPQLFFRVREP